jgi:anaerobic selenocysteine-containing dehydrogenase
VGLKEGIGKGTVLLEDFERADAIFVIGQIPGASSLHMMTELPNTSRRGVLIVAINPLRERTLA